MRAWWALVVVLVACGTPSSGRPPATSRDPAASELATARDARAHPPDGSAESAAAEGERATTITIATFNIRVFGKKKASNPEIMSQLAAIIRKYDVVAVQEVRDAAGNAPRLLLDAVNAGGVRTYAMLLSVRSGLQPDDKFFSQEQYAVLYDTAVIEALAGDRLFDDEGHDLFEREPYLTHLRTRTGGFSFVLIGIHTPPESAVAEIGALHDVMHWAQAMFPEEDDFIALGDFNAGCRYASSAELDALELRGPSYFWIVPDVRRVDSRRAAISTGEWVQEGERWKAAMRSCWLRITRTTRS